jgi:hypothetical protein
MKAKIFYTTLFIFAFLQNTFAQNTGTNKTVTKKSSDSTRAPSNVTKVSQPNTVDEAEKKMLEISKKIQKETNEMQAIIEKLPPAKKTRFYNINNEANTKSQKAYDDLRKEVDKIVKVDNIMAISTHIFSKQNPSEARLGSQMPADLKKKMDADMNKFNKLDKEKKKSIKKAIIKFRREIVKIQKQRKEEINNLMGKKFEHINQHEPEETIALDEKNIEQ